MLQPQGGTMNKFTINKDYDTRRTIEAENYEIKDGYFRFYDGIGEVATVLQKNVVSVDREAD